MYIYMFVVVVFVILSHRLVFNFFCIYVSLIVIYSLEQYFIVSSKVVLKGVWNDLKTIHE